MNETSRLFISLLVSVSLLVYIPSIAGDSQTTLILRPTDLTLNANITGGNFSSYPLNVSESCWKYTFANNTTWCDTQDWHFDFSFEFNSIVPRFINASLYLKMNKSGDNEQIRFKFYNWFSDKWIQTGFQVNDTIVTKKIGMVNMAHSILFGSIWFGFTDFQTDNSRTILHFYDIWMEVQV